MTGSLPLCSHQTGATASTLMGTFGNEGRQCKHQARLQVGKYARERLKGTGDVERTLSVSINNEVEHKHSVT